MTSHARWPVKGVLLLSTLLLATALPARAESDDQDAGFPDSPEEPEEYEYIETPHMESTGTFRSERWKDNRAPTNMRVSIDHPTEGSVYEDKDVIIQVNVHNVPEDEGYSGMLYFGSGNPFPIPLDTVPVSITVTDLAPGNYSVKFMLLDDDRQPAGVDADVNFERRAPPGFKPPKPDNSKFDSRMFEISMRFALAQQSDVSADRNPFRDAFRNLARDNTDCHSCIGGNLSEADELLGQAIPLILGVQGRNVDKGLEVLQHCADLGNVNCRFLSLALGGIHERLGLFGADAEEDEGLLELERCASEDKAVLCRLALGFRHRHGLAGEKNCELAAVQYRLAADHAVMFSQEDASSGPLHSVRLLEHTAVAAEQEKAVVEELRVVEAAAGNSDAAAAVAIERYFGTGYTGSGSKEEDKKSAAKLFHQAAEADNPLSLNNLGVMYQNGVGVPKNDTKAFGYFSRSAALGNAWGINSLAACYVYGTGVAPNRSRGIELWHEAAAKGNTAAHTNLGMVYREGQGPCPPYCRDYSAAYYHLDQAASRGDSDALLFLGLMIKAGEYVAPDCEKSCMAFKQCGERGPWAHLLNQGFMAWNAGDKIGAFIRYRLAAELGYRTALANIGFIYEHGIDDEAFPIAQDLSRAIHFYDLCAKQGDAVCRRRLGDMHYYGEGVLVDYAQAAEHYRINENDPQSCFNLAWLTERGLGVALDREAAKELYQRASQLGFKRRLAFESSDAEFSEIPSQILITKLEIQDEICCFLADLSELLATTLPPFLSTAGHLTRYTSLRVCGHDGVGKARPIGTEGWLSLWGLRLEWLVAVVAGICTLCSTLLGPCFLHVGGSARSRPRRQRHQLLPPSACPPTPSRHTHQASQETCEASTEDSTVRMPKAGGRMEDGCPPPSAALMHRGLLHAGDDGGSSADIVSPRLSCIQASKAPFGKSGQGERGRHSPASSANEELEGGRGEEGSGGKGSRSPVGPSSSPRFQAVKTVWIDEEEHADGVRGISMTRPEVGAEGGQDSWKAVQSSAEGGAVLGQGENGRGINEKEPQSPRSGIDRGLSASTSQVTPQCEEAGMALRPPPCDRNCNDSDVVLTPRCGWQVTLAPDGAEGPS